MIRPWPTALATTLAAFAVADARAAEKVLDVQVLEAYTSATSPKQTSAEVYARFVNVEAEDTLESARADVCIRVDLVGADGMRRPYADFNFKEDVETGFREGGPHLHLEGIRHPLSRGQSIPITLRFESGSELVLVAIVQ